MSQIVVCCGMWDTLNSKAWANDPRHLFLEYILFIKFYIQRRVIETFLEALVSEPYNASPSGTALVSRRATIEGVFFATCVSANQNAWYDSYTYSMLDEVTVHER